MKIPAPDNRKPVELKLRLDAETYDRAQLYKQYRAEQGDHFATDSQLFTGIIGVFFEEGDPLFKRWRKSHPLKAVTAAMATELRTGQKKIKKANGVDPYPLTTTEPQGGGSDEK